MIGARPARRKSADVVIVGCGPIGMVCANLLGATGVTVLVVEQAAALPGHPRAVALDDEGMRTLQHAGVLKELLPHLLLGYHHQYFGRKGELLFKVDPADQEHGYPKRVGFHQPHLEQVLLQALTRFANVDVAFSTRLCALQIGTSNVMATLADSAGEYEIDAKFLVGCDGGASTTRGLAGVEMTGQSHPEPWIVIDTENNDDTARFSRANGDPVRPNVNVPGAEGRRRYEFMLLPGERPQDVLSEEAIAGFLKPHVGQKPLKITRSVVYTFHSLLAERFDVQRRVFLAGDAAHMMPPFQGQGMNSGLRDAANLSWKLAATLKGVLGAKVLDTYDEERRAHAKAMVELSRRVGALLMTRNALLARFRDLAFLSLAKVPRASAYLRQMGFKPKPQSTAGYFLPDETGWPGRLFPQPEVIASDTKRVRLDEVLGDGFSLLHIANGPSDIFAEFAHPYWRRLGARRVLAIPGGLTATAANADVVVGDLGSALARAIEGAPALTLLLRPDRYVCATIKPGMANVVAARLDALAPVAPGEVGVIVEASPSSDRAIA